MIVTVVSTSAGATGRRCVASVASQRGVTVDHVRCEGGPPKLANLSTAIATLPAYRIVAVVDGDDWLAHDLALKQVAGLHADGAWMTYGSFRHSDGRAGFAAPVVGPPRLASWSSTHLVTFRAGLFQAIQPESMKRGGDWLPLATDVAMVLPMLEMAGRRAWFDARVHYVYDLAASGEWHATATERRRELDAVEYVRSGPAYARLEVLP